MIFTHYFQATGIQVKTSKLMRVGFSTKYWFPWTSALDVAETELYMEKMSSSDGWAVLGVVRVSRKNYYALRESSEVFRKERVGLLRPV